MEKESFENEQIAEIMNEFFINIKVDREERPDIDRIYMTFVQACVIECFDCYTLFLCEIWKQIKYFICNTYYLIFNKYSSIINFVKYIHTYI